MNSQLDVKKLAYTKKGKAWIEQFDQTDRETAEKILQSLTLISHSEFERSLTQLIEQKAHTITGKIALFAVREIEPNNQNISYFELAAHDTKHVNALSAGADHGSEARVAAIIRNLCKSELIPFLNHPTLETMRKEKCRAVFLIDDFIGSGSRAHEFLDSFTLDKTINSWLSSKYFQFHILAYSGTEKGIRFVNDHKSDPITNIYRSCPSFHDMPWTSTIKKSVLKLCSDYGKKTSQGYYWDGYAGTMASIVFEHGCPDNTPAILWASNEKNKPWFPIFDNRTVSSSEFSAFPQEIIQNDPIRTLIDVGQIKLANSSVLQRRGKYGLNMILLLALIAKGQRAKGSLSYALALNEIECCRLIEICIKFNFITKTKRITAKGMAELNAAKRASLPILRTLDIGTAYYYPSSLRRATYG